jgi:hypothetical protein
MVQQTIGTPYEIDTGVRFYLSRRRTTRCRLPTSALFIFAPQDCCAT